MIDPSNRKELLAKEISRQLNAAPTFQWTRWCARVESQSDYQAVIVNGRPVNHILHFLLCFPTFGLWVIVWLLQGLFGGENRILLNVDDYGNVNASAVK